MTQATLEQIAIQMLLNPKAKPIKTYAEAEQHIRKLELKLGKSDKADVAVKIAELERKQRNKPNKENKQRTKDWSKINRINKAKARRKQNEIKMAMKARQMQ